jgi:RNA polymerase sigma-70 factor (sigma-E family)
VDDVFAELYANRRVELVRLAALLLRDPATAEDVVQEAYIRCYQARGKLRDPDSALAYLRRAVVNTARSAVRRRLVAWRNAPLAMPAGASAEQLAWQRAERDAVVAALRALPPRQREAVVLRYYGDLSEIDTARAMGCSTGSVKAHTSRGLSRLAGLLEGLREERR